MIETWQQHELNYSLGSETHLRMRGTTLSGRANRQHLLLTQYKPYQNHQASLFCMKVRLYN
jgi:hypothetical protein